MVEIIKKQRGRVYEQIVEAIQQLIRDKQLVPGDHLLSERQLAKEFGVGRNAVREAVKNLESKGLIEIQRGGGATVRAISVEDVIQPLCNLMIRERGSVLELLEARRIIEVGIAELAGQRAGEDDVERIAKAGRIVNEKVMEGQSAAEEDLLFHGLVAQATHNRVLIDIMAILVGVMRETYGPSLRLLLNVGDNREMFCEQVDGICEALRERDGKRAAELVNEHVSVSAKELRRMLGSSVE